MQHGVIGLLINRMGFPNPPLTKPFVAGFGVNKEFKLYRLTKSCERCFLDSVTITRHRLRLILNKSLGNKITGRITDKQLYLLKQTSASVELDRVTIESEDLKGFHSVECYCKTELAFFLEVLSENRLFLKTCATQVARHHAVTHPWYLANIEPPAIVFYGPMLLKFMFPSFSHSSPHFPG